MMTDYMPLLLLIFSSLLTVLGYGIKLLWDIRERLSQLNGRIGTCEALRCALENENDKRHDHCDDRIEIIERKFMETR
jgi:hypothetical protein